MSGWAEIKRPFRDALIDAYDWDRLNSVLKLCCDRRLDLFTSAKLGFEQNVDDVIENAERTCWLEKLAECALAENDTHGGLKKTVPHILAGIEQEGISYYRPPHTDPSREYFEPVMVLIPEGEFWMGSDRNSPEEMPRTLIDLPAYYIAIYPVTNEQYALFLWDNNRLAPKELLFDGSRPPDEALNYPVTGVTWYEALEYCQWLEAKTDRRYRLPNEAQWEKAARFIDGRLFPWGEKWELGRCNIGAEIAAVDAFPAQSEYGCYDMVGNALEWTLTAWGDDYRLPDKKFAYPWRLDRRNDPGLPKTIRRVCRGGRKNREVDHRCSTRVSSFPYKRGQRGDGFGFRVIWLPDT